MLAGSSTASSMASRYVLLLHRLAFIVSLFRVSAVRCAFPIVTLVPVIGLFVFCIFEVFVFWDLAVRTSGLVYRIEAVFCIAVVVVLSVSAKYFFFPPFLLVFAVLLFL
jgi:hypothetical protein